MSVIKNAVLLLKSEKSDGTSDKYEDLLRSEHFEVIQVKTLTFVFKNIGALREKLESPEDFSGIVLSSPRCVNAVNQALSKDRIRELWESKSNFVVGETTYKAALSQLSLDCKGKEAGNANNLCKIIVQGKSNYTKPFLFPHGNLKTDTLQLELGKDGLGIEGVLVYDTIANPNIEEEFARATDNFRAIPEFVVFFSPSGLHSSINLIRRIPVDADLVKFVAIGPVTELAMNEDNLAVYGVAKSPTAEDVLRAINKTSSASL